MTLRLCRKISMKMVSWPTKDSFAIQSLVAIHRLINTASYEDRPAVADLVSTTVLLVGFQWNLALAFFTKWSENRLSDNKTLLKTVNENLWYFLHFFIRFGQNSQQYRSIIVLSSNRGFGETGAMNDKSKCSYIPTFHNCPICVRFIASGLHLTLSST